MGGAVRLPIALLMILAACRTGVLSQAFWQTVTGLAETPDRSILLRCPSGHIEGSLSTVVLHFGMISFHIPGCNRGQARRSRPHGVRIRANIRFRFQAMVTRFHSPRT